MLTLCAAAISVPGGRASAQEGGDSKTFDYVVQPGDTCARIAERFFGDKRKWNLIHENNPGMGPTPHRLKPGSVLRLPHVDQGPDAKVTDVQRIVQARAPKDPEWERARRGKELYRGWRVNTLERAAADVTFRDGSVVQMRQNTLIIIYGDVYRAARRRTTEASLERGALRSRLGELRLDVTTPTGQAGLEGGSSVVSVDEQGTSLLSNHEGGEARFKVAAGQAVRVKPGFGSKARKGDKKPSKPKPLPPTPAWQADATTTFTGTRSRGGTVAGAWAPVEAAALYRVELAKEPDGSEVVVASKVPSSITRFEIHGLPEGDYFARVSSIDDGGFESPQSPPQPIRVRLLDLAPPGATPKSTKGAALPSDPAPSDAPPGPAQVLPGTEVVSPDGFACSTGGDAKSSSFTLAEPGTHEIDCATSDGTETPTVMVEVVAPKLSVVEPATSAPLVRQAGPRRVVVEVSSELPLPDDTRFRGPDGIQVVEVEGAEGRRTLELSASEQSPDWFALELVTGPPEDAAVLAVLDFTVAEQARLSFAPNEALGLALSPNVLGLVNDRREGSGAFATVGYWGDPGARKGFWRMSLGFEIAPVRRVRFGLATPIDVHRVGVVPEQRGDRDILLWAGYRIVMRNDLSIDTDLGVWFPTSNKPESIVRTRFVPAANISYVFNDRWLVRTRQGAILETSSGGPFVWASAYGLDIKVVKLLAINGEVDVVLGRSLGQAVTGVGAGPGVSVLAGPASIYFAARFAATEDFEASNGKYTLTGGLRLAFE